MPKEVDPSVMLSQREPFAEDPIELGTAVVVVAGIGAMVLKDVAGKVGKKVLSTLRDIKDKIT